MLKSDNDERQVEVQEPNQITIIVSNRPDDILRQFIDSVSSILQKLDQCTTNDQFIFKACIVLAISALDHYIHEIVKYKILLIFDGRAPKTPSYNNFIVSLQCVERAIRSPESLDWLEEEIKHRNSYKSFQRYEKIAEAVKLIYTGNIWDELSELLSIKKADLKRQLDDIIIIRDDISHQDGSTSPDFEKKEITSNVIFIRDLVLKIHETLNK